MAADARKNARAGRTGFHVGAELLTKSGEIITGCNLELNSTLISICAERCAICKAVSMGYEAYEALAVVSDALRPVAPCGVCRQFLIDFGLDWTIIMANASAEEISIMKVRELAPMAFLGSNHI
jgi:cytidine deaminase